LIFRSDDELHWLWFGCAVGRGEIVKRCTRFAHVVDGSGDENRIMPSTNAVYLPSPFAQHNPSLALSKIVNLYLPGRRHWTPIWYGRKVWHDESTVHREQIEYQHKHSQTLTDVTSVAGEIGVTRRTRYYFSPYVTFENL
jgi:hypothetical protein